MGASSGGKRTSQALTESITAGCFFLVAVSYKLAWTAISSLLSQFSRQYGPEVLLQLNVAYFLPSIPVLMLQTSFNDAMDRRLGGLARGSLLRFAIGLGGLAVLTAHFPAWAATHNMLLVVTAAVGVSYGVVFGTSYQLASRFPPSATVMLTTGFVSSGPIVLALDLAIKRGTYYTPQGLQQLFIAVAWITLCGLVAACSLVLLNLRLLQPSGIIPQRVELGKMLSSRTGGGAGGGGILGNMTLKATRAARGVAMGNGSAAHGQGGGLSGHARRNRGEHEGSSAPGSSGGGGGADGGNHTAVMMDMDSQQQYHPASSLSGELQTTASGRLTYHHQQLHHYGNGNGVGMAGQYGSQAAGGSNTTAAVAGGGGYAALQMGAGGGGVVAQRGSDAGSSSSAWGAGAAGGKAGGARAGGSGMLLGPSGGSGGSNGTTDVYLGGGYDASTGKQRKPEVPLLTVAVRIVPAALSIFLSVGTSMLVFPFFTYMRSTGLMNERLPQVLFYVRLVGDILGRLVPRSWQARTVPSLMLWALIKTVMVPLMFGCIFTPEFTGGDLGAVVVVAVFWVLSGYVNTCAYLVAPTLVPVAAKGRASGLMTVAFQSSCFLALIGAAAVQQWSSARLTAPGGGDVPLH